MLLKEFFNLTNAILFYRICSLGFDSKAEYYKKWRFVSSMQQERSCCAVATWADESQIVVMGGQCEGSPLSSVEVYYPESDRWLSLPPMSEG